MSNFCAMLHFSVKWNNDKDKVAELLRTAVSLAMHMYRSTHRVTHALIETSSKGKAKSDEGEATCKERNKSE